MIHKMHNDHDRGSKKLFTPQQLELFEKIVKVGDEKLRLVPTSSKECNLSKVLQDIPIYLVPEEEFIGFWKDWCNSTFAEEMREEYHKAINKLNSGSKSWLQGKHPRVEKIEEELADICKKIKEIEAKKKSLIECQYALKYEWVNLKDQLSVMRDHEAKLHKLENELRKQEEDLRMCEEDLRMCEEELRKREEDLRMREEDLRKREAELQEELHRLDKELEDLKNEELSKVRELRDLERKLRPWDTLPLDEEDVPVNEDHIFDADEISKEEMDKLDKEFESSDYDPNSEEDAKIYQERCILDIMYGPWISCEVLDRTGTYTYMTPLGYYLPGKKEIHLCLDRIAREYPNHVDEVAAFTLIHELGHAIMDNVGYVDDCSLFGYWAEESLANKIALQYLSVVAEELNSAYLFKYARCFVWHQPDAYKLGMYLFQYNLSDWFALKNNKPRINKDNGKAWVRFIIEHFVHSFICPASHAGEAQYLFYKTFDF